MTTSYCNDLFSAHQVHLFSCELSKPELDRLRSDAVAHGETTESERTYVAITRLGDLMTSAMVDWSTLGAITQALLAEEPLVTLDADEV
jgi:hypothetical protein